MQLVSLETVLASWAVAYPHATGTESIAAADREQASSNIRPMACRQFPRPVADRPRLLRVASPEAKNLEAISKAIDQHNSSCPFPAAEVRMNPFEVERLGWEHIRGLPVVPDAEIGTGRFRIVCSRDVDDGGLEMTEAVGKELETVAPSQN